ncbi:MAG: adenylate/guanylate cyclase domain-containing protein [Acidimicrobiia bacterium]
MTTDQRWGRAREFLLSVGEFEEETADQRGRRRIVVGILWLSAPALALSALNTAGPWLTVLDLLKAGAHFGALLAIHLRPNRIGPILFVAFGIDMAADVATSILLGGLYDSGLPLLWSMLAPLVILVVLGVRAAVVWFGLFIGAVLFVVWSSSWAEPRYELADPELDGAVAIVGVTIFVMLALSYFVRQRDQFQKESDDLLHNILPDEVARRLKESAGMIAEHFDDASVLFLDIVGFTPMSAAMKPAELVGLLNEIFTDFDAFVADEGLEKIKTVGDEYMVAAGVPTPRPDHAHAIADLALRIQDHLASHEFAGHRITARIGVNSGPVVAGIIGSSKFSYDLWGEVVNTASRMESHGEPGAIQISATTYQHVRDAFECEPRGTIEVKGIGQIDTWFLRRRMANQAAATD